MHEKDSTMPISPRLYAEINTSMLRADCTGYISHTSEKIIHRIIGRNVEQFDLNDINGQNDLLYLFSLIYRKSQQPSVNSLEAQIRTKLCNGLIESKN